MTKQSNSFLFHVSSRGTRGGNNKDIRKNGDIPGNIFGLSLDSTMISCPLKMVQKHRSDFEGGLFYVQIDSGEKIPCSQKLEADSHTRMCRTKIKWTDTIIEQNESAPWSSLSLRRYTWRQESGCCVTRNTLY